MDSLASILLLLELQDEFSGLKIPGRLAKLGYPFKPNKKYKGADASPIIQTLLDRIIFTDTLPGVNRAPPEFWSDHLQVILEAMSESNLSDSYDHGRVSKRKMLGFAMVTVLHSLAKGVFGKVPEFQDAQEEQTTSPDGDEGSQQPSQQKVKEAYRLLVYEDGVDRMVELLRESSSIDNWPEPLSSLLANARYTMALLLHFVFVGNNVGISANLNQGTAGVVERIYTSMPWFLLRQVVRVGNVGSLVSGLTRLFLIKPMSWFGNSRNLLQSILAGILNADVHHADSGIDSIELDWDDDPLWLEQRDALLWYVEDLDRIQQMEVREKSLKKKTNICVCILQEYRAHLNKPPLPVPSGPATGNDSSDSQQVEVSENKFDDDEFSGQTTFSPFSEECVDVSMRYLNALLIKRDRKKLTKILCDDDKLSEAVKVIMNVFCDFLFEAHRAADFSRAIYDYQCFLHDLIAIAKKRAELPEFVALVDKYAPCFMRFVHCLVKNAPDLCKEWCVWYDHCLCQFRVQTKLQDVSSCARKAFDSLDDESRERVKKEIAAYEAALFERMKGSGDVAREWLSHLSMMHGSATVTPEYAFSEPRRQVPGCEFGLEFTREVLVPVFRELISKDPVSGTISADALAKKLDTAAVITSNDVD